MAPIQAVEPAVGAGIMATRQPPRARPADSVSRAADSSPDSMQAKISAAVTKVDGVMITPDVARLLVYWLGQLAEVARQRNGWPPRGLVEVQTALAEGVAAAGSRGRESEGLVAAAVLRSGEEEPLVGVEDAAKVLGIRPDTVRWHCRRGNLETHEVGGHRLITAASLERLRAERSERTA
jgi:Helix-turn-helix domain